MKNKKINFIWLILFTGLILRLIPTFTRSLWDDEAFSIILSLKRIPDIIKTPDLTHPSLYYLLLHHLLQLTTNNILLRLPSVIAGVLLIFFVYKIGLLVKNKTYAAILGCIFAFSPFFIQFSWQIRAYVFSHLFLVLSIWFFLMVKRSNKPVYIVLYFISLNMGFMFDYGFIWFILTSLLFFMLSLLDFKRIKSLIFIGWIVTLAHIILIISFINSHSKDIFETYISWLPPISHNYVLNQLINLTGLGDFTESLTNRGLFEYPIVIIVILSLIYMYHRATNSSKLKNIARLSIGTYLISFFVPLIISIYKNIFLFRSLFPAALAIHFSFSILIDGLFYKKSIKVYGLIIYLISLFCFTFYYVVVGPRNEAFWEKTNWKVIAQEVKHITKQGDALIFLDHNYLVYPFLYYYNRPAFISGNTSFIEQTRCNDIDKLNVIGKKIILIPKYPDSYSHCLENFKKTNCKSSLIKISDNLYSCR